MLADQNYRRNRAITPLILPAINADNEQLTLVSVSALPEGLSYDPATKTISGTPTQRDTEGKLITVRYHDAAGNSVEASFKIRVRNATVSPDPELILPIMMIESTYPKQPIDTPKDEVAQPTTPEEEKKDEKKDEKADSEKVHYQDNEIYNPTIQDGMCYTRRPYL